MSHDDQLTYFDVPEPLHHSYKAKQKWENGFHRWCLYNSNKGLNGDGVCGFGEICDWCSDNSYGRPCVRALNAYCRENRKNINYENQDFRAAFYGEIGENNDNSRTVE